MPSNFPLTRETETNNQKTQFCKTTILRDRKKLFGTWQFGKIGVLVNFINQELKFCKIAQIFFSVSLMRGKFEGTRESLFLENSGHSPCYFISVIFYKVPSGFKLFFGVQVSRACYIFPTKF